MANDLMASKPLEGDLLLSEPKTFPSPESWALVGKIIDDIYENKQFEGVIVDGEVKILDHMNPEEVYDLILKIDCAKPNPCEGESPSHFRGIP